MCLNPAPKSNNACKPKPTITVYCPNECYSLATVLVDDVQSPFAPLGPIMNGKPFTASLIRQRVKKLPQLRGRWIARARKSDPETGRDCHLAAVKRKHNPEPNETH